MGNLFTTASCEHSRRIGHNAQEGLLDGKHTHMQRKGLAPHFLSLSSVARLRCFAKTGEGKGEGDLRRQT